MLKVNIFKIILNYKSKTISLLLFLLFFLSTFLVVYFWIFRFKQNINYINYNYEFLTKINFFIKFKSFSSKNFFFAIKNIKRSSIKAKLEKSSTCQDLLRFKYKID